MEYRPQDFNFAANEMYVRGYSYDDRSSPLERHTLLMDIIDVFERFVGMPATQRVISERDGLLEHTLMDHWSRGVITRRSGNASP